jgi:hypothetical protein
MTKHDLAKFAISDLEQLERPLPAVFLIRGKLAPRRDDDGNEINRLLRSPDNTRRTTAPRRWPDTGGGTGARAL